MKVWNLKKNLYWFSKSFRIKMYYLNLQLTNFSAVNMLPNHFFFKLDFLSIAIIPLSFVAKVKHNGLPEL